MRNIVITSLKVLVDEKCDEIPADFKKQVGEFIKTVVIPAGGENLRIL